MQIDMDRQVAEWINNEESLYLAVLDTMVDLYEELSLTDADRMANLADVLECEVLDFYLSGSETEAGSWLIRQALATVNWYALAHDEYSDFLADRGE